MKTNLLIETENVKGAVNAIRYLESRPVEEIVGLGLLYGQPGLGKTRFARVWAIRHGWIYIRLEATMTAKSFLSRLLRIIYEKTGRSGHVPRGSSSTLLDELIVELQQHRYNIVIDEIDHAFPYGKRELLGTIRDIVDETLSIVLLVGMGDAKDRLMALDAHYFDRCNAFYQFKPLSSGDVTRYLKNVSEVDLSPEEISDIYVKSGGTMRKLVKLLVKKEMTRPRVTEMSRSGGKK